MPKELISVIVPVYNVELFLEECLDSIVSQTYKNLEIICVNDGSQDSSTGILKKFTKKDNRISIINKKNAGLSAARNTGIDKAKGKYISFIDSDDFISADFIEDLYQAISRSDADIAYTDNINSFQNDGFYTENHRKCPYTHGTYILTFKDMSYIKSPAWNKLYKIEFLNKYKLKFCPGLVWEDRLFMNMWKVHFPKIAFADKATYYHRKNVFSISSEASKGGRGNLDSIKVYDTEYGYYKKYDQLHNLEKYKWLIKHFFRLDEKYRQEFFDDLKALFYKFDGSFLRTRNKKELKIYHTVMQSSSYKAIEKQYGTKNKTLSTLRACLKKLKILFCKKKK